MAALPRSGGPPPLGLGFWWRTLLAGHGRSLAAILSLGVVSALVALVPPYLTKLVIDDGLLAGDRQALVVWSLALLTVGAGALGLGVVSSLLHMRASVAMLAGLRQRLLARVLRSDARWRAEHSTGELMNRIDADAGEVQRFAFNALLTGSGALVRLSGALAMLFWLHWPLALLAVALAPIELAFLAWARPRTEHLTREVRQARGDFAGRLGESLQGLTTIRQIGAAGAMLARLGEGQRELNARQIQAHRFGEVTRTVPALITAVGRSLVFLLGGLAVIDGRLALGTLIAFIGYLGFLVGPMQSLLGLWHGQARARVAFERIERLLDPNVGATADADAATPPPGGAVGVRRGGADGAVWISAGEKIRLDGPSGVGKTRMLRALQEIDGPSEAGDFVLTDEAGRLLDAQARADTVVHVPQRPFVMRGTVAENLRLLAPAAADEALNEVLDVVGLTARFAAADGLETRLGEDGLSLSGGERQRLCLARALLRGGALWLFDEALSEVDRASAARIWLALDRRLNGATRIIVAHDPESCGAVDRVIRVTADAGTDGREGEREG